MNDFEVAPLTVSERQILANQEREKRKDFFCKIGYNSVGCYEITFPNGKKYIGKSKHLGQRLKKHLENLIPIKRTRKEEFNIAWYYSAVNENRGKMTKISDLNIKIWYDLNCDMLEKQLLSSIPKEE